MSKSCDLLKDKNILGAACASAPSRTHFTEACETDLCVTINAAGLDRDAPLPTICDFLSLKAAECIQNGFPVPNWPNDVTIAQYCRKDP